MKTLESQKGGNLNALIYDKNTLESIAILKHVYYLSNIQKSIIASMQNQRYEHGIYYTALTAKILENVI
jgi:hypothetical protein